MGPRSAKPEKSDIRQLILRFLKTRGRAQVDDVAKHFRVTHEGARKHLVQMEESGWIVRIPESAPKVQGRPKDSYSVSPVGDQFFPKAYDRLSIAILEAL